jgi:phenylacetate-CoA ligase
MLRTTLSRSKDHNLDLLSGVLRRAKKSNFYKNRVGDLPSMEAWEQIPFTTKEDLRHGYPFELLAVNRQRLATYHESTGTSGNPTSSYFTENDWEDIASRFSRNAVGLSDSDVVLIKTPYSMVTTAHQMHRAARMKGALVVPADNRTSNMPYSKVIRLLKDLPVSLAWCLPTETLLWAETARLEGYDSIRDFPNLRALLIAGEPVSEPKRKRIEHLWGGIPVYQDYGSTETGSLAGECVFKKLHAWSDRVFFEIYDEQSGKCSVEGRGQLVVTPLYREGMPLVRYCLGDVVELNWSECPCGWGLPVLRILGRHTNGVCVQGKTLFPSDLEEAVYQLSEDYRVLFWRARYSDVFLHLQIETDSVHAREACQQLTSTIEERFGVRAEVMAVRPGTIVSHSLLRKKVSFKKPRFLFESKESWNKGIHY